MAAIHRLAKLSRLEADFVEELIHQFLLHAGYPRASILAELDLLGEQAPDLNGIAAPSFVILNPDTTDALAVVDVDGPYDAEKLRHRAAEVSVWANRFGGKAVQGFIVRVDREGKSEAEILQFYRVWPNNSLQQLSARTFPDLQSLIVARQLAEPPVASTIEIPKQGQRARQGVPDRLVTGAVGAGSAGGIGEARFQVGRDGVRDLEAEQAASACSTAGAGAGGGSGVSNTPRSRVVNRGEGRSAAGMAAHTASDSAVRTTSPAGSTQRADSAGVRGQGAGSPASVAGFMKNDHGSHFHDVRRDGHGKKKVGGKQRGRRTGIGARIKGAFAGNSGATTKKAVTAGNVAKTQDDGGSGSAGMHPGHTPSALGSRPSILLYVPAILLAALVGIDWYQQHYGSGETLLTTAQSVLAVGVALLVVIPSALLHRRH